MKVSLVATVLNARPFIHEFRESVRAQTRSPDEVVVVDGGSNDGTWEALRDAPGIVAISQPGANIATGRNVAIRAATHDAIAVTDADCVLAPDWLERIVAPLERGAAVSAGFYRPLDPSLFQVYASAVSMPEPYELRPGWLPSSRSIAFQREAWEAAGTYPEWLEVGEDMYFDHRLVDTGAVIDLVPDAVTYFRIRPDLSSTWRRFSRYAEGDALAGMYRERHLLRFAVYALALATVASRRTWLLGGLAAGAAGYASRPVRRAWRRLPRGRPTERLGAVVAVPALMALVDTAKMSGYVRGLVRRRGRATPST